MKIKFYFDIFFSLFKWGTSRDKYRDGMVLFGTYPPRDNSTPLKHLPNCQPLHPRYIFLDLQWIQLFVNYKSSFVLSKRQEKKQSIKSFALSGSEDRIHLPPAGPVGVSVLVPKCLVVVTLALIVVVPIVEVVAGLAAAVATTSAVLLLLLLPSEKVEEPVKEAVRFTSHSCGSLL